MFAVSPVMLVEQDHNPWVWNHFMHNTFACTFCVQMYCFDKASSVRMLTPTATHYPLFPYHNKLSADFLFCRIGESIEHVKSRKAKNLLSKALRVIQ